MSQQINLFNPVFLYQKKPFAATSMALAAGALVLGLAGLGAWGQLRVARLQGEANAVARQYEAAQKRLAAVSAEFKPRAKDPALAGQLLEAERQHAALRHVAQLIEQGELGDTRGYAEYFRALAREKADGLWLTAVSIDHAGRDIGVQGRALDPALVPAYLARLRSEPSMQGKAFGSLQMGEAAAPSAAAKDGKDGAASAPYVEFSLQSAPAGVKP